jgi:hypothetical protein
VEEFFFALIPITFILSFAGVLIFRPLTKRLGSIMEANALVKREATTDRQYYEHVKALLDPAGGAQRRVPSGGEAQGPRRDVRSAGAV